MSERTRPLNIKEMEEILDALVDSHALSSSMGTLFWEGVKSGLAAARLGGVRLALDRVAERIQAHRDKLGDPVTVEHQYVVMTLDDVVAHIRLLDAEAVAKEPTPRDATPLDAERSPPLEESP